MADRTIGGLQEAPIGALPGIKLHAMHLLCITLDYKKLSLVFSMLLCYDKKQSSCENRSEQVK